jgi:uncharacterized membrane-anchored protein YhcB (DUF1043 family)
MDVTMMTELVSTLGFPIALVIAMGFFIWQLWKQSVAREEKLMSELTECRLVNTQAITTIAQYAEKLDTIQKDVTEIKSDMSVIMSK